MCMLSTCFRKPSNAPSFIADLSLLFTAPVDTVTGIQKCKFNILYYTHCASRSLTPNVAMVGHYETLSSNPIKELGYYIRMIHYYTLSQQAANLDEVLMGVMHTLNAVH